MIKAVLLDGDGVTLKKHKYFSELYAEKNNIDLSRLKPFFTGKFRECQQGKADLKKELVELLPTWNWSGSVEEFIKYWFTTDTDPDSFVLDVVQKLRSAGKRCFLVTDQEKYRAQYLNEQHKFSTFFDKCFYSCDLGFRKSEKEFFQAVVQKTGFQPEEIIYLDDDLDDVATAKELGLQARLYTGIDDLKLLL